MCAIQRGRSQKPPYSVAEGIGEEANPPGSWSASSTAQRRCLRLDVLDLPHLQLPLGSFSVGWRGGADKRPGETQWEGNRMFSAVVEMHRREHFVMRRKMMG